MGLKDIRPMLRTLQFKETVMFYKQKLGFTCVSYDEDRGWAALQRDTVEIMVALPVATEDFEKPLFSGSFYFIVDKDIEQLWQEYSSNAKVCYPLETFDYGMREFAIYDNNGYLLQFGQEDNARL